MMRHRDTGVLCVEASEGREYPLPVGGAVEDRVPRRARAMRARALAVEEMWRHPELRPGREVDAVGQGMTMMTMSWMLFVTTMMAAWG
ncbi:hypothetical protein FNQ90_21530 [Streptomyces alkaliphilus]|uniref:Uncharacterized protein n=1 Tax=Streptomyces alkaliphilus TaxID=1472722 RepID=A0A7W3Y394_9ACTN|nr:hypothetical protein [Streptomyces alkaliphilus]